MAHPGIRRSFLSLAVAGALAGGVTQAHASGFALIEQNASGLGNSYAGAAAVAEDASTIFYNPAGMSFLPAGKHFVLGAAYINVSAKFSDSGSQPSGTGTGVATALRPLGSTSQDAGTSAVVPNFYFAMDVGKDWMIGIGVSTPFGLKTEYDPDWVGRYQAIKSDIKSYNINPSVSYKVNEKVSLGFGLDYQHISAELTNAVNFAGAAYAGVLASTGSVASAQGAAGAVGNRPDGTADLTGSDDAWGYNLGAMFQLSPQTRLGATYRSSIKYHVEGHVEISNTPTAVLNAVDPTGTLARRLSSGDVTLDITVPDSMSFALRHELNPNWALLADATWTGWSKFKELNVKRNSDGSTVGGAPTPENFKDTWRFGVGATYRASDAWSLKMGAAYDQSPVNNVDRTPRLPDQDRMWLSIGGQYRLSKDGVIDFGWAHLLVKDASIDQTGPTGAASGGRVTGTYNSSIDILGAQFSYKF